MSVTTHELGDALGWRGHSLDKADVMYKWINNIFILTERDKKHLNQIY
jgi:predicted Zn-dependent protease